MNERKKLNQAVSENNGFNRVSADCPYCGTANAGWEQILNTNVKFGANFKIKGRTSPYQTIIAGRCSVCEKIAIAAQRSKPAFPPGTHGFGIAPAEFVYVTNLLFPKNVHPDRAPKGISPEVKQDYDEARAVLSDSPQAAATLARRCLQHVLITELDIPNKSSKGNFRPLISIINDALAKDRLSGRVKEALQHVREIGNIGAHPEIDAVNTLIRVTSDEAIYTLEVLEWLFEELYVHSERSRQMQQRIEDIKRRTGKPSHQ